MKKIVLFLTFICVSAIVLAQNKAKTAGVKSAPIFKNITDSFSYALGVQVASFYKQQGVEKINSAILSKAVNDIYTSGKSLLSQRDMDLVIMGTTSPDQYKQCRANLSVGEK